jgi:hypothetical protein
MQYRNDFDQISNRSDLNIDRYHRMVLKALAKQRAIRDMEEEGLYVSREVKATSLF